MELSDRERRLLAEIEQNLRRRDRAFARRIDALNGGPLRSGPQRFACYVSRREIVCLLAIVIVMTVVLVSVTLVAGGGRPVTPLPPHPPTVPGPGQGQPK
ncbi:MAG TPA: DUF3040 domain-containing protein [Nonomuraea sp.]|nr:DUF3040 domain-containing protein [Nonomuraea sp.]